MPLADPLLITVRNDLVLLFLDIDPQLNIPKIAEQLTDDGHHPDDAHQQLTDVTVQILRPAPELPFVTLEAMKLY